MSLIDRCNLIFKCTLANSVSSLQKGSHETAVIRKQWTPASQLAVKNMRSLANCSAYTDLGYWNIIELFHFDKIGCPHDNSYLFTKIGTSDIFLHHTVMATPHIYISGGIVCVMIVTQLYNRQIASDTMASRV